MIKWCSNLVSYASGGGGSSVMCIAGGGPNHLNLVGLEGGWIYNIYIVEIVSSWFEIIEISRKLNLVEAMRSSVLLNS